jgi:hypothetical protein
MKKSLKNLVQKKRDGQALLVVLVISTLTLMLLLGVASRINAGRTNVRRSAEFDRAYAASENALNDIIKAVSTNECEPGNESFVKVSCSSLSDALNSENQFEVFGRVKGDAAPITIQSPLTLFLSDDPASTQKATGVKIDCSDISVSLRPGLKFSVTLLYYGPSLVNPAVQEYQTVKGIFDCADPNINNCENVVFFKSNGVAKPAAEVVDHLQLARVRLLDSSVVGPADQINVKISVYNRVGTACNTVAQTGDLEYMVVGLGGLNSDNIVKFEKARGDYNYIPALFDFVYFGEDI